ncbi:MAG: hypothetical protein CMJ64_21390 [Planctomycetaceae bacterium]|jgi:hypothetical protein|nr:hypothetical protein [Planctomycetaceae bacterium]
MAKQERQRTPQPVCPEHWQKMRNEAIKGLPFWTRPFASGTVDKRLRSHGFVESSSECAFCKTKSDVDDVK